MLLQADSLACASASALLAAAMAALTGSGACTQGACAAIRAAQAEVAALQVAGADRAPAAQWPGAEAAVPWVCTSFRDILTMCSVALQSRYVQPPRTWHAFVSLHGTLYAYPLFVSLAWPSKFMLLSSMYGVGHSC